MTFSPKSIALVAALTAQSIFVAASPASAIPISFPDVSFPDPETRQGCYYYGTCNDQQTSKNQKHASPSGAAAPEQSPRVSTKGKR